MDYMEEDDEVIRELDVYMIENQLDLLLLQFPLKPIYSDPPTNIHSTKYKPVHKKLDVELFYPTEVIQNADLRGQNKLQQLESSLLIQNTALGVGVIRDNCLHITPLNDVLQMRTKLQNKQLEFIEPEENTEDGIKNEGAMQQIQLKRKETERAQTTRTQSYTHLHTKEQNEQWVPLKHHEIGKSIYNYSYHLNLMIFSVYSQ